jgi:hypothetical protein
VTKRPFKRKVPFNGGPAHVAGCIMSYIALVSRSFA